MTQEEKAKAYDEAVKRAKAAIDMAADKDLVGGVVKTILPELRESESEDERIRKALIDLVCTVGEYYLPKLEARNKMLDYLEKQKEQKPAEWSEDTIRKAVKEVGLTQHQIDWFKNNVFPPKPEWSEEDEHRRTDAIYFLESAKSHYVDTSEIEKTIAWLEFLRPQYHGDVTMTEAYKMGLEAGKASSWKPSEEQTNNVIVELTRVELGDIINGLYYLKEKYYEDCKEHNGTATVGLSDEFKFYFKRFNEALDLYTRLHELEKERYVITTDGYYYE